jgi:DNA-binding MarR family transcriptional regulator
MTRLQRCLLVQWGADEPSLTEDSALSCLHRNGPMTIGELAAYEDVGPSTMTRVVSALQAHRLVTRHHVGSDQRRVTLELTPLGHERAQTGATLRAQWLGAHLDALTEHQRFTLSEAAEILGAIAVKDSSSIRVTRSERRVGRQ